MPAATAPAPGFGARPAPGRFQPSAIRSRARPVGRRGLPVGRWRHDAAILRRDSWPHTGDLGSVGEDGFLTLRDRSRDRIISGGGNIYPREIEEVLECSALGRHPDRGAGRRGGEEAPADAGTDRRGTGAPCFGNLTAAPSRPAGMNSPDLATNGARVAVITAAAANGHAISGGSGLALACDIRFRPPSAALALREAKRGFHACGGGLMRPWRRGPPLHEGGRADRPSPGRRPEPVAAPARRGGRSSAEGTKAPPPCGMFAFRLGREPLSAEGVRLGVPVRPGSTRRRGATEGRRTAMAATGLEVFDRTLHTTHIWLDEIMAEIGPDRQAAWHVLSAVLRTVRDRVPLELAVHLGAQLPLLVRGVYYDQWHLTQHPERTRDLDEFLERVADKLRGTRPVNVREATRAVMRVLSRHVDGGQIRKIVDSLPQPVRDFWPLEDTPPAAAARAG